MSRKRNLGLLVARMVGLRTLLFLDDDITEVSADAVRLAAGHLLRCAAVGLAVEDFPDNSVVCHANRLGGGRQTVFVSGSALLVDVHAPELSHFPTVYNEDWLFLFDALAAGRVRREGTARQLRYDPFSRPGRAREEEFGDVVAEGLLAYLELGGRKVPMSRDYWVGFLRRRAAFLARASERLAAGRTTPQRRAALGALAEANARSAEIQPAQIVRFLREWRDDRESWRARLATVESGIGVASALRRLGLGQPNTGRSNLAVVVPGFLDSPANPAHRAIARALELAGLRTVLFTPRGLPIRPGEPFTATATEHLDDLAALLREHAAPDGQVVVVGHSYGAWLAGLLADREERVTHLVALMPTRFFLWPNDYLDSRDTWRRRGEILLSYPEPGSTTLSAVRLPHTLVSDASRYDLPAALGRLRIPVLFVAGTDDTAVPSSSVIRLYDECGSPAKQYVDVPVGHDYRKDPAHIGLVNRCVLEWLGR